MGLPDIKPPLAVFTEGKSCDEKETMMVVLEGGVMMSYSMHDIDQQMSPLH